MKLGAALANGAWLAASIPSWNRFRRALSHPGETQSSILRGLVTENASSAYGLAHGFGSIGDYRQFCDRVPVVGYEELEPWIERIMRGERGVLTTAPVTRLVPTSGSSGARKLIPFTQGLQKEFNAAIGPWMIDLCRQHPAIALGPAYWSISPALPADNTVESAVPIGFDDDSAYLGGIRQRLAEATFAAPSALRLVSDLRAFRYLTLLCLLRQPDLRLISVWHPSFLTLLFNQLPQDWPDLLRDINEGGPRRYPQLPESLQRIVEAPAMPQRARALGEADPKLPTSLWPRLKVVSCWGDGQATLAVDELQKRLSGVAIQPKGLLATEGVVSVPFRGLHPIAVSSHFYEFADADGKIHTADQLRAGEQYSVILTTSGGIWRYRLGDQVEVDGFVGSTPSLRFLGRGGKVSDLCGEKLHETFVTQALTTTFRSYRLFPTFALLAPETPVGSPPHYTLFTDCIIPIDVLAFLEHELKRNPHYAHCRNLGQLGPLVQYQVSSNGYEVLANLEFKSGRRLGDIKPQSLSNRTDLRGHLTSSGSQTG